MEAVYGLMGGIFVKKDMLQLAREELQRLDQSIRDCSDRLIELSPLDIEAARLRVEIMEANTRLRTELDKQAKARI